MLKQCYLRNNKDLTENNNICIVHINVISVLIAGNYCKYMFIKVFTINVSSIKKCNKFPFKCFLCK